MLVLIYGSYVQRPALLPNYVERMDCPSAIWNPAFDSKPIWHGGYTGRATLGFRRLQYRSVFMVLF